MELTATHLLQLRVAQITYCFKERYEKLNGEQNFALAA